MLFTKHPSGLGPFFSPFRDSWKLGPKTSYTWGPGEITINNLYNISRVVTYLTQWNPSICGKAIWSGVITYFPLITIGLGAHVSHAKNEPSTVVPTMPWQQRLWFWRVMRSLRGCLSPKQSPRNSDSFGLFGVENVGRFWCHDLSIPGKISENNSG